MANPSKIVATYPDGFNLYALVFRKSDGYIYDVEAGAFEAIGTWNNARVDECDIPLTGYKAGLYMVNFPSISDDDYITELCLRAGASPATTDAILGSQDTNMNVLISGNGGGWF